MHRIDIRIPVEPVSIQPLLGEKGRTFAELKQWKEGAFEIQRERYIDSNN